MMAITMKLKDEILELIQNARHPLNIEMLTRRSKLTRHEARVGYVVRELVDEKKIKPYQKYATVAAMRYAPYDWQEERSEYL